MYPYHNRIKQRIQNGELTHYEYVATYNNISPCLVLYFNTEPYTRPVRVHRFDQYKELFKELDLEKLEINKASE